jgi:hypothetical protein
MINVAPPATTFIVPHWIISCRLGMLDLLPDLVFNDQATVYQPPCCL